MNHFHLLGIGGIGMSALARILLDRGHKVSGTDLLPTPLAQEAEITPSTTVVYSTAIPEEQLGAAKATGCRLLHRSELLEELMRGYKVLAVTGTHGKTTTSSMLAWVLQEAGWDPGYALGGILLERNGKHGGGEYFVLEADESDASHLRCRPHAAIVTNVEAEHLDYWGSAERMEKSFDTFISQVEGPVFCCAEDPYLQGKGIPYAIDRWEQDGFSLWFDWGKYCDIEVKAVGRHNAQNACAVFALCLRLGVPEQTVRKALATFPGVGRRLEWKGKLLGADHYDDYAHHPTEVITTLEGLHQALPDRRIRVVFQPHRYTRLEDNLDAFVFPHAHEVWITDVWSAGEKPIPGVDSQALADRVGGKLYHRLDFLRSIEEGDIIVTMGAGKLPALLTVGLIYGGDPSERDISIASANFVAEHIPYKVRHNTLDCDVVFPLIHGPKGEDGLVAATCEALDLPFVGCDFRSSSLCMNKAYAKAVAKCEGIATLPWVLLSKNDPIPELPPFPLFVKPVHLGSSIGVSKVTSPDALASALERAFALDSQVIVEEGVVGRELAFAVLGDWVPPPGEWFAEGQFFTYEAKYGKGHFALTPIADLPAETIERGQRIVKRLINAFGCRGMVRFDFFLDEAGTLWFNEANPVPGFGPHSMYPTIFAANGLPPDKLVDKLISLAIHA